MAQEATHNPDSIILQTMKTSNSTLMKVIRTRFLISCLLLTLGATGYAQEKLAWSALSPGEREVLQQLEERWDELSAERQERLRRGASRWLQMGPEERQSAQTIQRRFQNLTPQQQQQINQRFQRFNLLERDRQQQLRNIQRRFRSLPEEERARLREQFDAQAEPRRERQQERAERLRQIRDRNLGGGDPGRPTLNDGSRRRPSAGPAPGIRPGGALPVRPDTGVQRRPQQ